ncbi:MAG: hypothetical protein P1S60_18200, partial [Anaerolineae bacterium]|nr:hypothetical protein [Anaerolineae bacterium]
NAGQEDAFVTTFSLVPTPTPTATPTPIPTPIPQASASIGPEGGTIWMSYPGHLTLLHVPDNAVSAETFFELTYEDRANFQGDLQGLNHFFHLGIQPSQHVILPLKITLGFVDSQGIMPETLTLYRLDSSSWVTGSITIAPESNPFAGHIVAQVDLPGHYGVLGQTRRLYVPLMLRQQ